MSKAPDIKPVLDGSNGEYLPSFLIPKLIADWGDEVEDPEFPGLFYEETTVNRRSTYDQAYCAEASDTILTFPSTAEGKTDFMIAAAGLIAKNVELKEFFHGGEDQESSITISSLDHSNPKLLAEAGGYAIAELVALREASQLGISRDELNWWERNHGELAILKIRNRAYQAFIESGLLMIALRQGLIPGSTKQTENEHYSNVVELPLPYLAAVGY